MRHGDKVKKLGRDRDHRRAMLNNLATSILLQGLSEEQMTRNVKTTLPKAKAVRSLVERLISYAKKGDLSAKRQAARFVKSKEAFKGLFEVLGERYQGREGGYTRILKLGDFRHGDNAEMAYISLVEDEIIPKPKKKKAKKKSSAKSSKPSAKSSATEAVKTDKAEAPEGKSADAKQGDKPAEGAAEKAAKPEAKAKTETKAEKSEAKEPEAKKAKAESKAEPKAKKDASEKADDKDGKKS